MKKRHLSDLEEEIRRVETERSALRALLQLYHSGELHPWHQRVIEGVQDSYVIARLFFVAENSFLWTGYRLSTGAGVVLRGTSHTLNFSNKLTQVSHSEFVPFVDWFRTADITQESSDVILMSVFDRYGDPLVTKTNFLPINEGLVKLWMQCCLSEADKLLRRSTWVLHFSEANLFFISHTNIKLVPFEVCQLCKPISPPEYGSWCYLPDEAYDRGAVWEAKTASYGMGVLMYKLLFGSLPYKASVTKSEFVFGAAHLDYSAMDSTPIKTVSEAGRQIVRQLLASHDQRATIGTLLLDPYWQEVPEVESEPSSDSSANLSASVESADMSEEIDARATDGDGANLEEDEDDEYAAGSDSDVISPRSHSSFSGTTVDAALFYGYANDGF
jgi:hypothetical protein